MNSTSGDDYIRHNNEENYMSTMADSDYENEDDEMQAEHEEDSESEDECDGPSFIELIKVMAERGRNNK